MKNIILIIALTLFWSCSLTKETTKDKIEIKEAISTDRIIKEHSIKKTYRPKDSVIYVPNYKFKDTTIYKKGSTNTIITRYNSQGQISQIDCISDAIQEILETFKKTTEKETTKIETSKKNKTADTKFKLNSISILYIFIGLIILLLIHKKL